MWRYTGQRLQIGPADAWVAVFLIPAIKLSYVTLYLALGGVAIFGGLSWVGISPLTAYRFARAWFTGGVRPAVRRQRLRRLA